MKITTWNINGIRSLSKAKIPERTAAGILNQLEADFLCLQETKLSRDQLGRDVELPATKELFSYDSVFVISRGRTGYAGVTTYFREEFPCVRASEGLTNLLHSKTATVVPVGSNFIAKVLSVLKCDERRLLALDMEGRAVISEHLLASPAASGSKHYEHARLFIVNVYCPRSTEHGERALYKMQFHQLLEQRVRDLQEQHAGNSNVHIIVTGDINVCHRRIDSCDGQNPDFEDREPRQWLKTFMVAQLKDVVEAVTDQRLVDTFRNCHPLREKAYTCWSQFTHARQNNFGTRIDYTACTQHSVAHLQDAEIMPEVYGSDHCPVYATFCWKALADAGLSHEKMPPASLCSSAKYQSQSLLRNYFTSATQKAKEANFLDESCDSNRSTDSRIDSQDASDPTSTTQSIGGTPSDDDDIIILDSKDLPVAPACLSLRTQSSTQKRTMASKPNTLTRHDKKQKITDFFRSRATLSTAVSECTQAGLVNVDGKKIPRLEASGAARVTNDVSAAGEAVPSQQQAVALSTQSAVPATLVDTSWTKIFSGPTPPPLCSGHKIPAVLRQSKKKGSNFGRYFYVCSKALGAAGDPNSRCDFFRWQTAHEAKSKKVSAATSVIPKGELPGFVRASQITSRNK